MTIATISKTVVTILNLYQGIICERAYFCECLGNFAANCSFTGLVLTESTPFCLYFLTVLAEISHPDQRFLLHDVLEDIDVPTLTLWGDNDKVRKLNTVICFISLRDLWS